MIHPDSRHLSAPSAAAANHLRWSRHISERCQERRIAEQDIQRILERPFVSGSADQEGVRWHVGPARCGPQATWHWIKVIELSEGGRRILITSYALVRPARGKLRDRRNRSMRRLRTVASSTRHYGI